MTIQIFFSPGYGGSGQFQQGAAQTPYISFNIVNSIDNGLWSHPVGSSFLSFTTLRLIIDKGERSFEVFGTAEVTQFDNSFVGEQNVGAFQVFVHDFVFVQVIQGQYKLFGKMQVCLKGRRAEVLVKLFQCSRNVLHENQSLLRQVIVLDVPHDIVMRYFRQYIDLCLALLLISLAQMHFFYSIQAPRE